MEKKQEYFRGVSVIKITFITFIIGLIFGLMFFFVKGVRAEDNKTIVDQSRTAGGYPKILGEGKWSTQLLWDTTNACYQGTIRWIVMTNPSLLGQAPNVMAQRQMVVHCFCVVDKIRKELTLEEYIKMVRDPDWSGNIFMTKAMECVREWQTLPLFFTTNLPTTPEKLIPDNSSSTKDEESLPDQKQKEFKEESPLIFQG
jgi:hypothetical protein